MRGAKLGAWAVVAVVLVFLFAPVVLVVLFSFNSGTSTSLPLQGLSLRWYRTVFSDPEATAAMANSVKVALGTVAFSLLVGTAAAFALARRSSRILSVLSSLILTPLIIPGLFIGIALLAFFSELHVGLSLWTAFVGHALITIPFVVVIVGARLARLDRSMMEAARDLGAGPVVAFRKVLLPVIGPALLGAGLLVLAWSADEFVITLFTYGSTPTIPVLIYTRIHGGLDPSINAIASLVLGVTILATSIAGRFISNRDLIA